MPRTRRSLNRDEFPQAPQAHTAFVPAPRPIAPPIDAEEFARFAKWVDELTHYLHYSGDGDNSYVYRLANEINGLTKALSAGASMAYLLPVAMVGRPYDRVGPMRGQGFDDQER